MWWHFWILHRVNDFFRWVPPLQRPHIAETRKEARAETKLLESAATRILVECTLRLLYDEMRLCFRPSGGARWKINHTGDENDSTRLAAREANGKSPLTHSVAKQWTRGGPAGSCPPALCATLKTVKGAAVDLSSRLSPFSTFGEPVSAPQTGARTGVYGEPAPTVCKWGQSGVRLKPLPRNAKKAYPQNQWITF